MPGWFSTQIEGQLGCESYRYHYAIIHHGYKVENCHFLLLYRRRLILHDHKLWVSQRCHIKVAHILWKGVRGGTKHKYIVEAGNLVGIHHIGEHEEDWRHISKHSLQWRHNERDGVSNHRHLYRLLNRLFRRRSKKHLSSATLAIVRGIHRWIPLTKGQWRGKYISIWWRHHGYSRLCVFVTMPWKWKLSWCQLFRHWWHQSWCHDNSRVPMTNGEHSSSISLFVFCVSERFTLLAFTVSSITPTPPWKGRDVRVW